MHHVACTSSERKEKLRHEFSDTNANDNNGNDTEIAMAKRQQPTIHKYQLRILIFVCAPT